MGIINTQAVANAKKDNGSLSTSFFASARLYTSYGNAATLSAYSTAGRTAQNGLITAIFSRPFSISSGAYI